MTVTKDQISALANLAAEHLNCTGCPTPWWLNNWLLAVASSVPIDPSEGAGDQ